jgi:hypothetical protein
VVVVFFSVVCVVLDGLDAAEFVSLLLPVELCANAAGAATASASAAMENNFMGASSGRSLVVPNVAIPVAMHNEQGLGRSKGVRAWPRSAGRRQAAPPFDDQNARTVIRPRSWSRSRRCAWRSDS